ncbi:MAG TPA: DUF6384 family protein [Devosiaceae bacterium]|nr:DUF6384 family protein [Devosiaceae bacterium]
MNMPKAADAAPLDDEMLVMDVADIFRRAIDIPLDSRPRADAALIERLRTLYLQSGIEVSDQVFGEGLAALSEGRFVYAPRRGLATGLAQLYASRLQWGRPVGAAFLVLAIVCVGYFFGYRPYEAAQAEQARIELTQTLPAKMDALYDAIFNDTKVQTASDEAATLREQGKEAAGKGDRAGAESAIADLTALRNQLEETYTLKIVDTDGVKPGFWTFPPNNSEATNYYIVVEAVDGTGNVLSIPITSEDTGVTQTVSRWAIQVPQSVYDSVMADKQDDGSIQHNLVGFKQDGFTDVDYLIPVLGGALTQW